MAGKKEANGFFRYIGIGRWGLNTVISSSKPKGGSSNEEIVLVFDGNTCVPIFVICDPQLRPDHYNFSFENGLTGWSSTYNNYMYQGSSSSDSLPGFPPTYIGPDDNYVAWTNIRGDIFQILPDQVVANTVYTLTVDIGRSDGIPNPDFPWLILPPPPFSSTVELYSLATVRKSLASYFYFSLWPIILTRSQVILER